VTRLVERALELGVNLFDTAADYGTEEFLGNALAGSPRDSIVVSTKFGPTTRDGQLKPASAVRESVLESLRRLRMDYVDVLYLHGVRADRYDSIVAQFLEPMQAVQHAGLAHFIGVTESWGLDHAHSMLCTAIPSGVWDVVMPGYNLLSPMTGERVLPLAAEHDVGTMIMCAVRSVMSQPSLVADQLAAWKSEGLLARDAPASLDWVIQDGAETLTAAAYKFAADHPGVSSVLCGTGNIAHLEDNVKAILGPALDAQISARLKSLFVPVGRNVGHGMRA
jgi:L-galactose dehydrogenase